ncbi:MAG: HEAT repeat domain-containing protein [Vicinamibacterales bacterium]
MSAEALVRMVLFAESLALALGVTCLVAHAVWWWWYDRWIEGHVSRVRAALRQALTAGDARPAFARDFVRLPMRLQIYLLGELAPHLTGAERQALRRLARHAGLLAKAERLCRSWFWSRRLFGAKICTLVGHPADIVLTLLADRNASVRAQAIEWALHRPEPAVVEALLAMLGDHDGRCRFAAQDTLVKLGHAAVAPLIAYLPTAGHAGSLGALDVALTIADARLLPAARALASSPEVPVRARAVALLGALGSADGVALVVSALNDAEPRVRQAALKALGALGHWPAAPQVAGLVLDPVWDVRRQAALCLRALGAPGAIYLRQLRGSDDPVASSVARYALDLTAVGATS